MPQPVTLREAEFEWFYEDLQDLLELTLKMSVCVPLCLYINVEHCNCNLQKLEHGLRTGHGT